MNLSELDINLIEAYIDGTLQDKEKVTFEERLSTDKAFAKEVTIYKKLISNSITYFYALDYGINQLRTKGNGLCPITKFSQPSR